jgi:hypothetical protein
MVTSLAVWVGALVACAWLVGDAIATRLHNTRQRRKAKT